MAVPVINVTMTTVQVKGKSFKLHPWQVPGGLKIRPAYNSNIFNKEDDKMSLKRIYLENKSDEHYKFYEMVENGDGTFVAKYGKIDTGGSTKLYSMREWDETLSKKLNKGYKVVNQENCANGQKASIAQVDSMVVKLRILISTIEEVLTKEPNDNMETQLATVFKIKDRISKTNIILGTDLKYCNRLFKKVVNKRKTLLNK